MGRKAVLRGVPRPGRRAKPVPVPDEECEQEDEEEEQDEVVHMDSDEGEVPDAGPKECDSHFSVHRS